MGFFLNRCGGEWASLTFGFQLWKRWVKTNDETLPFGKVPVLYSYDVAHRSAGGETLTLANEVGGRVGSAGRPHCASHFTRAHTHTSRYINRGGRELCTGYSMSKQSRM